MLSKTTSLSTVSTARLVCTVRMCRTTANVRNRNTTGDKADSGRQQVDMSVCVCFSTHTLWSCYAAGEWGRHYWTPSVFSLHCAGPVAACRQSCVEPSLPTGLMMVMMICQ